MASAAQQQIQIVVIGDGTVGKTSMLITYTERTFPTNCYIPTIFDEKQVTVTVKGQPVQLILRDTSGQEEFSVLKQIIYPNTHVFMVCYALNNEASLKNVPKWIQDAKEIVPTATLILVGTKADLAHTTNLASEASELAQQLKIRNHLQCSSKTDADSVNNVFKAGIKAYWKQQQKCHLQ